MHFLQRVISGGQTGADQAGLYAAKRSCFETGGMMPKGFITEKGPRPEFARIYSMQESTSSNYAIRTGRNVFDSDGTIRFASDFNSAGEKLTFKCCMSHGKPLFDVPIRNPPRTKFVVEWIRHHRIRTLNIAGNRESTSPGIFDFVVMYLTEVFKELDKIKLDDL